jgi:DNA-binding PucR family transcriptional regulator
MGRAGWIDDPDDLAVERLLLLDDTLLEAIVRRELGPLLDVPRMGEELVETLRVFFEAGENIREAARRMHLASRTVAYRLERIEELLGHPIDGEIRPRLAVALLAYQALEGPPADG